MNVIQNTRKKTAFYSLYLSTKSTVNPPNYTNLNNVNFQVNFTDLWGYGNSMPIQLFVSARLITSSSSNFTWLANKGTVRCSLGGIQSNNTNGMNLGSIVPVSDPSAITTLQNGYNTPVTITGITSGSPNITASNSYFIFVGKQITIVGTAIGNLTSGNYYVNAIINSTTFTVYNFVGTSTASGNMTAFLNTQISTPISYLLLDTTQNTSSYQIIKPEGIQNLNIQILDRAEVPQLNVTDWEIFLYFYSEKDQFE